MWLMVLREKNIYLLEMNRISNLVKTYLSKTIKINSKTAKS